MEEQLQNIVESKHIYGISLWPYFGQGYLGALLDRQMEQIPGSVPWNPYPTVQEVLDSLERAAVTLRNQREQGTPPPAITIITSQKP
jgi:hypothetical protein